MWLASWFVDRVLVRGKVGQAAFPEHYRLSVATLMAFLRVFCCGGIAKIIHLGAFHHFSAWNAMRMGIPNSPGADLEAEADDSRRSVNVAEMVAKEIQMWSCKVLGDQDPYVYWASQKKLHPLGLGRAVDPVLPAEHRVLGAGILWGGARHPQAKAPSRSRNIGFSLVCARHCAAGTLGRSVLPGTAQEPSPFSLSKWRLGSIRPDGTGALSASDVFLFQCPHGAYVGARFSGAVRDSCATIWRSTPMAMCCGTGLN